MGAHLARRYVGDSSSEPDPLRMPTFSPDYGFPERKERGEAQCAGAGGGCPTTTRPAAPGWAGRRPKPTSYNSPPL
uniref:Uncharacterized protein n=1 Tax=Oryctolagus cuniculus TaxID=9986 RepID=G1U7A6_RABIT